MQAMPQWQQMMLRQLVVMQLQRQQVVVMLVQVLVVMVRQLPWSTSKSDRGHFGQARRGLQLPSLTGLAGNHTVMPRP